MPTTFLFSIFILTFLLSSTLSQLQQGEVLLKDDEKFIFLQEIARHGTRTAFSNLIKNDWSKTYGIGQLTSLGFRQHYLLGKLITQKYSSLINRRLTLDEIWVRSTGFNRTIQSAASHLQGMFENFSSTPIPFSNTDELTLPKWEFYSIFDHLDYAKIKFKTAQPQVYEPYPVMTPTYGNFDRFLKADDEGGKVCNKTFPLREEASKNFVKVINSSLQMQNTVKEAYSRFNMYDPMIEKYGFNFTNAFFISDAVLCAHENDPSFPLDPQNNTTDKNFYNNIKKLYSLSLFQFYNNTEYLRTVQTPILNNIRDNINIKVQVALGEKPKR